jgi:hypothetical protein
MMDSETILLLAVVGIAGLAALTDPSRAAEIIRTVVDAISRRKHK